MKTFDFVNVNDPTAGVRKADLSVIRSRAARTDPFDDTRAGKRRKKNSSKTELPEPSTDSAWLLSTAAAEFRSRAREILGVEASDEDIFRVIDTCRNSKDQIHLEDVWGELIKFSSFENSSTPTPTDIIPSFNGPPLQISYLGASGPDPFWTVPVPYQPVLPMVWNHYITHLTPRVSDLDNNGENNLLGWFNVGFTEPASLYAHLAFGASHLASTGTCMATLRPEDILSLKACAISLVNAAIADPQRATSDSIISTVMILAGYEFAFGDIESYNTHMKGCQRMIKLRGGLQCLDPFFQNLFTWIRSSGNCWKIFWPVDRGIDVRTSLSEASKEMAIQRRSNVCTRNSVWRDIPDIVTKDDSNDTEMADD